MSPFTYNPKLDAYVYDPNGKLRLPPGPAAWSQPKPKPAPKPEEKKDKKKPCQTNSKPL